MYQWRIQARGRGGGASLFLDQTEARWAEKSFFRPGPPLSQGLDDRSPLIRKSGSATVHDFSVYDCTQEKKTVPHTFLPTFDNANRRLCQVRLLWSRNFATMVTWRHTIVKTFRRWSWREFNTESLFLNSRYNRGRRNIESLAEEPGSTSVHPIKEF